MKKGLVSTRCLASWVRSSRGSLGFIDFAGVDRRHSVGGWVALAAVIIGPRIGRFSPGAAPIRADYLPLTTLGIFVLWVGRYGFNGGSTFGLTPDVPAVILDTTIAATFDGLAGLALSWRVDGWPLVTSSFRPRSSGGSLRCRHHDDARWKVAGAQRRFADGIQATIRFSTSL
jgi:ammonia channel protein AmtB